MPHLALRFNRLLLACALTAGAHAASTSYRFVSFAPRQEYWVQSKKNQYTTIQTPSVCVGAPVRVTAEGPLVLYTRAETEAGAPTYTPVATLSPVASPRQIVLILGGADGRVGAHAIPDTESAFPFGRVLAINLTDRPMQMTLGGSPCTIPVKGSLLCPAPKSTTDLGDMAVKVSEQTETGPKLAYSTVWPSGGKLRTLAFLYRETNGRLRVRTVEDVECKEMAEAPEGKTGKAGKH